jgi:hypothetical protein
MSERSSRQAITQLAAKLFTEVTQSRSAKVKIVTRQQRGQARE